MKRILHLHPTFCVGSGIDEVVRNLMKQTSYLGFECELACFLADAKSIKDVSPLKVTVCPRPKYVRLADSPLGFFPKPLGKILAEKSLIFPAYKAMRRRIDVADIVHAHFYPTTAFSLLTKTKDKKLVIHNYGITNEISGLSAFERINLVAARRSESLFSDADAVVSISDFLRRDLYEHTGIDSTVLPPGIDTDHFHFSNERRAAIRKEYNIPADAFVFLYVGRLAPYKRVDLLVDSFSKVKKKIGNSKLIIAPSPRCDRTLFEIQVKKLRLEKDVIFAKNVSFENMPSYYSACDVHASCSVWEGFGLPFVEAAACGKPSVGFAGIPSLEVFAENSLGLTVQERNAEAFAKKLIEAQSKNWDTLKLRSLGLRYSWTRIAKQMAIIYVKLL